MSEHEKAEEQPGAPVYGRPREALRSGSSGVKGTPESSNQAINQRIREAIWSHDPGPFYIDVDVDEGSNP